MELLPRLNGQNVVVTGAAAGLGQPSGDYVRPSGRTHRRGRPSGRRRHRRGDPPPGRDCRCIAVRHQSRGPGRRHDGEGCCGYSGAAIDVLLNNAGTNGRVHLVREMDLTDWEQTLSINLTGTMLVTREAIPYLVASGSGRVVNVASNVARRGLPRRADYVASKWALLGLTQTLALELVDDGIRVNAICPGPVEGDRIEQILADACRGGGGRGGVRCERLGRTCRWGDS